MGCNGSKSVAVVPSNNVIDLETNAANSPAPEHGTRPSSRPSSAADATKTRPVTPTVIPPSTAFEIPFDDDGVDESIVKHHPPLRLQKLEEQQQNSTPLTLEELNEKQEEAEQRRQQFLQLRGQSAKRKYALRTGNEGKEFVKETGEIEKNENKISLEKDIH